MKKEPIGVKGPMKKSEVYSSGSNLFAHKPVLTRKDSRPIKGGGEMDSPEGATIILTQFFPTYPGTSSIDENIFEWSKKG